MANRRRPIPKRIWFTEEEWHLVEAKMVEAEMTNFSAFGLEMLLHRRKPQGWRWWPELDGEQGITGTPQAHLQGLYDL